MASGEHDERKPSPANPFSHGAIVSNDTKKAVPKLNKSKANHPRFFSYLFSLYNTPCLGQLSRHLQQTSPHARTGQEPRTAPDVCCGSKAEFERPASDAPYGASSIATPATEDKRLPPPAAAATTGAEPELADRKKTKTKQRGKKTHRGSHPRNPALSRIMKKNTTMCTHIVASRNPSTSPTSPQPPPPHHHHHGRTCCASGDLEQPHPRLTFRRGD